METKKTRVDYFNELKEIVETYIEDPTNKEDIIDFIDRQIDALDRKKEAALRRAEKKKADSDALTNAIYEKIGDELKTVDEIVIAINDPEVTRNRVTSRLGRLVREGLIVKELVKVEGGKRMAYKRTAAEEVEETLE